MLIMFLRHGDAVQSPNLQDSERPLSDLGNQQAAAVGKFLNDHNLVPASIISSPLIRAAQTAGIVGNAIGISKIEPSEYLVPGTRKTQLVDHLNRLHPESVLLVGHEPHISQSISFLLAEHENVHVDVRKASLACLLASDPVRAGHAQLQWLVPVDFVMTRRRTRDGN
ncbi:MAG TPA: phosphohistidine phosphatase SixA [Bacteroidota bacterium]|nr:phosphohistidine phosphatase SixA [Bacteroidota bacterium]